MGWSNWAGFGEVFDQLGQNLGYKRLGAKYQREEAERAQAAEGRDVERHTQEKTLYPYQTAEAKLRNEGLGKQNTIADQSIQKNTIEIADLPAKLAREKDEAIQRARDARLRGDISQKELDHFEQTYDLDKKVKEAQMAASNRAGQASALEIEQRRREQIPIYATSKLMEQDIRQYSMSLGYLANLRRDKGKAFGTRQAEEYQHQIDQMEEDIKAQRFALVKRFRDTYGMFSGGKLPPDEYESWFTDIDRVDPNAKPEPKPMTDLEKAQDFWRRMREQGSLAPPSPGDATQVGKGKG